MILDDPHVYFRVATVDGQVAGYLVLIFAADTAQLANLAVDPARRRHGIGAALLDDALSCKGGIVNLSGGARVNAGTRALCVARRTPRGIIQPAARDAVVMVLNPGEAMALPCGSFRRPNLHNTNQVDRPDDLYSLLSAAGRKRCRARVFCAKARDETAAAVIEAAEAGLCCAPASRPIELLNGWRRGARDSQPRSHRGDCRITGRLGADGVGQLSAIGVTYRPALSCAAGQRQLHQRRARRRRATWRQPSRHAAATFIATDAAADRPNSLLRAAA